MQVLAGKPILCAFGKRIIGPRQSAQKLLYITNLRVSYATHFYRPSTQPLWPVEIDNSAV